MKTHLAGVFSLMLVAALAISPPAQAQEGSGHGIKVHGRWTIDVRNPDGALVSHHEFDNALDNFAGVGGSAALAGVLGRSHTMGHWIVALDSWLPGMFGGAPGPCASGLPCVITEQNSTLPSSNALFRTLTLGVPTAVVGGRQVPAGTVELSGNATMAAAGSITRVATRLTVCAAGAPTSACGAGTEPRSDSFFFTMHTLATPVQVAAGQIVQVRIVLSFS